MPLSRVERERERCLSTSARWGGAAGLSLDTDQEGISLISIRAGPRFGEWTRDGREIPWCDSLCTALGIGLTGNWSTRLMVKSCSRRLRKACGTIAATRGPRKRFYYIFLPNPSTYTSVQKEHQSFPSFPPLTTRPCTKPSTPCARPSPPQRPGQTLARGGRAYRRPHRRNETSTLSGLSR